MARDIDHELLAGFIAEATEYLPRISRGMAAFFQDPLHPEALEEAHRLMHSIKGAASMLGLGGLSHVAYFAEEALEEVAAGELAATPATREVLVGTVAHIEGYLATALTSPWSERTLVGTVVKAFRRLRELPEQGDAAELERLLAVSPDRHPPTPAHGAPLADPAEAEVGGGLGEGLSPELIEAFTQEAEDHLHTVNALLRQLEQQPGERRLVHDLMRSLHTLKGAAGMVGRREMSSLAHRMEDLLDRLYDGTIELSPEVLGLLFATADALEDLTAGDPDRSLAGDLLARYGTALGEVPENPRLGAAVAPLHDMAIDLEAMSFPGSGKLEAAAVRRSAGGPVVRVPIERLDELMRLVSELVVNRSTFEQHFSRLIREVDELSLSIGRLRRISTSLETDYELEALIAGRAVVGAAGTMRAADRASAPAAGPAGEEFDELELDRYNQFHLLSRELAETTSDIGAVDGELVGSIGDFDAYLNRMGRLSSDIQDRLMRLRMVPLATLASRLHRTVRVTAAQQGKLAELEIEGADLELDKTVIEEIADPLLHVLRNAVDHGIEPPALRRVLGKPERGQITLRASHEGTQVVLQVRDDGAGLDLERLRAVAVARGYVADEEAARLDDQEVAALAFQPGFSTADELTEISGRGVGLDIVRSSVSRIKGTVAISSSPGKGVSCTIRLPMTLAITRVLIVRANGELFAVPLAGVAQILRLEREEIERIGSEAVLRVAGRVHPMIRLGDALRLSKPADDSAARVPVLVLNLGHQQVALVVDALVEAREVVVKTLGNLLRRVHGVTGATLMGDGSVVLILNPADLLRAEPAALLAGGQALARTPELRATRVLDVLIVDDSLSVRRVLSNLVRNAGWNPIAAKDGVEALEVLQRLARFPDVILLDLEMPRMDGYELTAALRAQDTTRDLPIIVLTSRSGEKHRQKAYDLGITEYLVKPYQDETLLNVVRRVAREARSAES